MTAPTVTVMGLGHPVIAAGLGHVPCNGQLYPKYKREKMALLWGPG